MKHKPCDLQNPLPSPPDLVFRVGFAGKRDLDAASLDRVRSAVTHVLSVIGSQLVKIAPGREIREKNDPAVIARYYSPNDATLRLVHGLCEGADSVAFQSLENLKVDRLASDHTAVVPCDLASYRRSRRTDFLDEFDRQAAMCSYIIVPDGIVDKNGSPSQDGEVSLADRQRSRAYRCQSALLLRQSDLLIAALDPSQVGRPGGTFETVRAALDFELPVVLIHSGTGEVFLVEPGDNLLLVLDQCMPEETAWKSTLSGWVTNLVADPDRSDDPVLSSAASHGEKLMEEFFSKACTPPLVTKGTGRVCRRISIREKLWILAERHFKKGLPKPPATSSLDAYSGWRKRASELGNHYSGLYRGTYLLNHHLAVAAVFLAALSLVLIIQSRSPAPEIHSAIPAAVHHAAPAISPSSGAGGSAHSGPPLWLLPSLLVLGGFKLWIVISIFRNTHHANREDWNDKAVDYRYLAERLRALNYLPLAGSFQPPAAAPTQYTTRVVRQSAVDWLFDAIVRSVSPAGFASDCKLELENGRTLMVKTLTIDPLRVIHLVEREWIASQALYHRNNSTAMLRLSEALERRGKWMNLTVIIAVAVDIIIVASELFKLAPASIHPWLVVTAPWLLFLAALLPAAVAGLNGIRFQSECDRLAERSAVMHTILEGRQNSTRSGHRGRLAEARHLSGRIEAARADSSSDPGSWTLETLLFSEKIANDFVQEVAEWSVLYAKELVEP